MTAQTETVRHRGQPARHQVASASKVKHFKKAAISKRSVPTPQPLPNKTQALSRVWPIEDQGFAASLIKRKAKRLLRITRLPASDLQEIEQELTFQLWRTSHTFEIQRAPWEAFVNNVVNSQCSHIVRYLFAAKRDVRRTRSLHNLCTRHGGETQRSDVSEELNDCRSSHGKISGADQSDLRMDIDQIVRSFPASWQRMISLRAIYPMRTVSSKLGIPLSTLYGRWKTVRARFEANGFTENISESAVQLDECRAS